MKIRMWGDGLPPYHLLIHGTASSGQIWIKMLANSEERDREGRRKSDRLDGESRDSCVLAGTFIMPHLPGMGESEILPDLSFEGWVHGIATSVEEIIGGNAQNACMAQVHIVGHSLGAALAMSLAGKVWAASVSLICPATPAFSREMRRVYPPGRRPGSIQLRRVTGSLAHDPLSLTREDAAMLREDFDRAAPLLEGGLPWPRFCGSEAGMLQGKRVLIVWGEEDRVVDSAYARQMVGDLRAAGIDVTAIAIPDCGHIPMLERPSELLRILHEFWGG